MEQRKRKVRKTIVYRANNKCVEPKSSVTITRNVLAANHKVKKTPQAKGTKPKGGASLNLFPVEPENKEDTFSIYPMPEGRRTKTAVEKYCDSYVTKINEYAKANEYFYNTADFRGLKYHVTLTIDPSNKNAFRTGRLPVALSKHIRKLMNEKGVAGFGVLEKGESDNGVFHAHLIVDHFKPAWWELGMCHISKVSSGSRRAFDYAKKTLRAESACARASYFNPRKQKLETTTDYDYFSGIAKKGAKEVKLFASDRMKRMRDSFKKAHEVFEEDLDLKDVLQDYAYEDRMYFVLVQCVKDLFTFYRNWKKEGLSFFECQYINALGFDGLAKQVIIRNNGTNGYSLTCNLGVKVPEYGNTLWHYISNDSHSFSSTLRKEYMKQFHSFSDYVMCRSSKGAPML